jgi:hypothetical protein
VGGYWRRLHNGELHHLYASPNIITVITSRRMKSAGHEARMRHKKYIQNLAGKTLNVKGRELSEDQGVDGRISERILGKQGGKL